MKTKKLLLFEISQKIEFNEEYIKYIVISI